jgi:hypothetical protein
MAVPESLEQQRAGGDGEENADEGQRPRPSQRRAVEAGGGVRHVRRDEKNRRESAAVKVPAHGDRVRVRPHAEEHRSATERKCFYGLGCAAMRLEA